ncbi:unnamed protein product, partial [marine sediment metagenome]
QLIFPPEVSADPLVPCPRHPDPLVVIGKVMLSFPLFLLVPSIRDDAGTRYVIWTVLASHHLLALVFAFGGYSFSVDAESFHGDAVRFATTGKFILGIDFEFYTQVMARLYRWAGFFRLGGASRLLGAQISV